MHTKICKICNIEFKTNYRKSYCSPKCRSHAGKEKSRILRENGYFSQYEKDRFAILERDSFRCIYCGLSSIEDHAELNVDHVVPRKAGGQDTADNLITACRRCNTAKNIIILDDNIKLRIIKIINERNFINNINPKQLFKLAHIK